MLRGLIWPKTKKRPHLHNKITFGSYYTSRAWPLRVKAAPAEQFSRPIFLFWRQNLPFLPPDPLPEHFFNPLKKDLHQVSFGKNILFLPKGLRWWCSFLLWRSAPSANYDIPHTFLPPWKTGSHLKLFSIFSLFDESQNGRCPKGQGR